MAVLAKLLQLHSTDFPRDGLLFYRSDDFFFFPPYPCQDDGKGLRAALGRCSPPPVPRACPQFAWTRCPLAHTGVAGTESSLLKYLTKPYGALRVRGCSVR